VGDNNYDRYLYTPDTTDLSRKGLGIMTDVRVLEWSQVSVADAVFFIQEIKNDGTVRVLVLAGNGPAFCAGADLNWMKRMAGYGYQENLADAQALADMLSTLDRMPKPTIARVHGPAFAGGTGLVAACDIAVGTPEAKFCFSEAKLGLSPATISPHVLRAIGERAARRYFLTAEVFDALEAERIGLLSLVVEKNSLDKSVDDLLAHLTVVSADGVRVSCLSYTSKSRAEPGLSVY
jgi:methylglutaconyl-CoA hydratase